MPLLSKALQTHKFPRLWLHVDFAENDDTKSLIFRSL